jgi:hypothetical protein
MKTTKARPNKVTVHLSDKALFILREVTRLEGTCQGNFVEWLLLTYARQNAEQFPTEKMSP